MKKIICLLMMLLTVSVWAQKTQKDVHLPEANEAFIEKDYKGAEAKYRISQSKFPKKSVASYNLGNAIYRINQPSEARNAYLAAIENAKSRPEKHRAYHNLGNALMLEKNYQAAVDTYKQALINNPEDEETRYNFALAKKFLKDNPPPKDKKDKQDKKEDDKKKQDQPNKEDENSKDKRNPKDKQDNKDQGDKKDDPKTPKPAPGGISKQRVENLLEAVNNEERKVQDKINAKKVKGKPVRTEKDW